MTFQYRAAAAACRGLARSGRRYRAPVPVARALVQQGSRHTTPAVSQAAPTTRAYAWSAAAAAPRVSTRRWGKGVALEALPSSAGGGDLRGAFSTATAAGGDGEGKDDNNGSTAEAGKGPEAEVLAGAKEAETEAPPPASGEEENPLAGVVADDGDPGPPPPLDPSIVTGPSDKVLKVMEDIDSLNFMEMAMLIEEFKNKLGLDEVPTLNYGGADGGEGSGEGGAAATEVVAEKTVWKVTVTGFGEKAKIKVIKEVRAITGLGLREAKEVVESLPQVVKEDLKPEEAEAMKVQLEAAGATVELG